MSYSHENDPIHLQNDARHVKCKNLGLSVSVVGNVIITAEDSRRISEEGQNAANEISERIFAETGENPFLKVVYRNPNHDIHDIAWLDRP
ncbi:hypothetical protein G6L37_06480 [Agrobacterium rubi]|nr:hypothetical protein [Agrobacterium rubi]NTF25009.1 hypothetical protein [Agrobacterium rubi]